VDSVNVLFLGPSNATRGPLAEALGRHLGPTHGWCSAGQAPTKVHPSVRSVLVEEGIDPNGLIAKGLPAIALEEIDLVVDLDPEPPRLPQHIRRVSWLLPDPSSAPAKERDEAFRATRDELRRRIRELLR
jgi:protein-tyrosine-phosphatase